MFLGPNTQRFCMKKCHSSLNRISRFLLIYDTLTDKIRQEIAQCERFYDTPCYDTLRCQLLSHDDTSQTIVGKIVQCEAGYRGLVG